MYNFITWLEYGSQPIEVEKSLSRFITPSKSWLQNNLRSNSFPIAKDLFTRQQAALSSQMVLH